MAIRKGIFAGRYGIGFTVDFINDPVAILGFDITVCYKKYKSLGLLFRFCGVSFHGMIVIVPTEQDWSFVEDK